MTKLFPSKVLLLITLLVNFLPTNVYASAAEEAAASDVPQYLFEDGKVDKDTFNGYRRFHGTCHACHGQNASGSTFAPSLVESLKTIDYATYAQTVTDGRTVTGSDGSSSAMPSFKENPDIMKYMDDIYRYLKARSDGVLGGGRPQKIPQ